jgi:hypothetical protein
MCKYGNPAQAGQVVRNVETKPASFPHFHIFLILGIV